MSPPSFLYYLRGKTSFPCRNLLAKRNIIRTFGLLVAIVFLLSVCGWFYPFGEVRLLSVFKPENFVYRNLSRGPGTENMVRSTHPMAYKPPALQTVPLVFSNSNYSFRIEFYFEPNTVKARCSSGEIPKLLIMINSIPEDFRLRIAIRETWGNSSRDAEIFFLIGQVLGQSSITWAGLESEAADYGDILATNILEHPVNLTLKSYTMLYWAKTRCPKVPFVLKTDSDIISVPENLIRIAKEGWTDGTPSE